MKKISEIRQRILQLEASEKNGVYNHLELELLRSTVGLKKKDIKILAERYLHEDKYKFVRIVCWILEDSLNPGF